MCGCPNTGTARPCHSHRRTRISGERLDGLRPEGYLCAFRTPDSRTELITMVDVAIKSTDGHPLVFLPEHDGYADDYLRTILRGVKTFAMGGRQHSVAPAQLLRHEVPDQEGLSGDPHQPRPGRRDDPGRDRLRQPRRVPPQARHGGYLPHLGRGTGHHQGRHREQGREGHRGAVDAAHGAQRSRRAARRRGRAHGRHEPLPQDRVRPASRAS